MTTSRMTFGEHLKQFALSIDFLDAGHYDLVQRQLLTYLKVQLDAVQVALLEPLPIDGLDGIRSVWSTPTFRVHQTLREGDEYRRQLTLSLGSTRNLWVISENTEPLSQENRGIDVWGEKEDAELPPFQPAPGAPPTRTSVSMITRDAQGEANGVFLVDIRNHVRPTKILRRELQLLADAVGLLHATDWATREQRRGTGSAIARLADLLPDAELDTGPRPYLFVATSSRASQDVRKAIKKVLARFEDRVFARDWSEMHRPGNINAQLVEQIRGAQYGICYLSEPIEDEDRDQDDHNFQDNPNVLVEAGMLHMVTRNAGATDTGWIPIREGDSTDAPFDLENQRMVLVDREEGGALKTAMFERDLEEKLKSLLQGDESLWGQDDGETNEASDRTHLAPVAGNNDGAQRHA